MKLGQMFPSRYLRPDDLRGRTVVTIDKVDWQQVRNQYGQSKGEPEVLYTIFFREFPKPMKLKSTNAKTIAKVLGTEETDDWLTRRITIYPTEIRIAGEPEPVRCIYVDWVAPPSTAPQVSAPTARGAAALPAADTRPIGEANAERFRAALAEQGAKYDDFLAWLKRTDRPQHDTTIGLDLADLHRSIAPLMQRFLREYGAAPADSHADSHAEIVATSQSRPADEPKPNLTPDASRPGGPAPLDADDIPF
jgi:hypothetical protein